MTLVLAASLTRSTVSLSPSLHRLVYPKRSGVVMSESNAIEALSAGVDAFAGAKTSIEAGNVSSRTLYMCDTRAHTPPYILARRSSLSMMHFRE